MPQFASDTEGRRQTSDSPVTAWLTRPEQSRRFAWYAASLVCAVVAALGFAYFAAAAIRIYHQIFPFEGDTFSYYMRRLQDAYLILDFGRGVIWDLALNNPRNPLNSLALAVFPKIFLTRLDGRLIYNSACYIPFAFMLAQVVRRRTGLAAYALAATLAVSAIRIFYSPMYGFASELPDMPAAFLVGASAFALLASDRGERPGWILWFAVFAGLATLARISASMYVFLLCGPLYFAYLLRILLNRGWQRAAWVLGGTALILGVLIGDFMYRMLLPTLAFYKTAGYALGSTVSSAWNGTGLPFFRSGLGITFAALFATAFAWIAQVRWKDLDGWSFMETLWLCAAVPLHLVFIVRLHDDFTQMYYALPGFILLVTAPVGIRRARREMLCARPAFAFNLSAVAAVAFASIGFAGYKSVVETPASYTEAFTNRFTKQLAELFVAADTWYRNKYKTSTFVIDAGFDYYWRYVVPAALFAFGRRLAWRQLFEIRESQWGQIYRDMPAEQADEHLLGEIDLELNAVAVLAEPSGPQALEKLKDEMTIAKARLLRDHVRDPESGWVKFGGVDGPAGAVELYLNTKKPETDALRQQTIQHLADALARAGGPGMLLAGLSLPRSTTPSSLLPQARVDSLLSIVEATANRSSPQEAAAKFVTALSANPNAPALAIPTAQGLQPFVLNHWEAELLLEIKKWLDANPATWTLVDTTETPVGAYGLYVRRSTR